MRDVVNEEREEARTPARQEEMKQNEESRWCEYVNMKEGKKIEKSSVTCLVLLRGNCVLIKKFNFIET